MILLEYGPYTLFIPVEEQISQPMRKMVAAVAEREILSVNLKLKCTLDVQK